MRLLFTCRKKKKKHVREKTWYANGHYESSWLHLHCCLFYSVSEILVCPFMRKKHLSALFGTSCNIGNVKNREVGIYESPFTTCGVTQAIGKKKSNVTAQGNLKKFSCQSRQLEEVFLSKKNKNKGNVKKINK